MERIKLTKREKNVLRLLRDGNSEALSEFDAPGLANLARLGLIKVAMTEGGGYDDVSLTTMGKEYVNGNPHLLNPANWTLVFAAIAAIASVVNLFISCTKLI